MPAPTTFRTADVRVRVRRIPADGAYTRVTEVHGAGAETFVLIPGVGMGIGVFERLIPRLLPFGDVYTLEPPGFAGIRPKVPSLRIDDYAALAGEALDVLGLKDPVVIGHSMGSQIVAALAAANPDVTRSVLISPVVAPSHRTVMALATHFLRSVTAEPFGVSLLAMGSYVLTGVRSFATALPRMLEFRMEDRITEIPGRVLLVHGTRDRLCPPAWLELLGHRARAHQRLAVPRGAHSVMHRYAALVASAVVHFSGARRSPTEHASTESSWTLRFRLLALIARARGILALLRGDDRALGRSKTSRLRVALAAGEAADDRPKPYGDSG